MSEAQEIRLAADFAEVIVSKAYRDTLNRDFDANPETYTKHRDNAQALVFGALAVSDAFTDNIWESRRQIALDANSDNTLGKFTDFIHDKGGQSKPSTLELIDLGPGAPEVVSTNTRIVALSNLPGDPIDFMDSALEVIKTADASVRDNQPAKVGPENYATAIKLFANKYKEFPSAHLDKELIKQRVSLCLDGFAKVTLDDKPNFVEMTNIYTAVLVLPRGSFDQSHTDMLIKHSLEQLPNYDSRTLSLVVAALSKLDVSETSETAAHLIDLALRKNNPLETTRTYRSALRAIANLPETPAANRAFATFLDVRSKLEGPLDMEGLEEVNYLLLSIVSNVIDDPALCLKAQEIAFANTAAAHETIKQRSARGDLTTEQLEELKNVVRRITQFYSRI